MVTLIASALTWKSAAVLIANDPSYTDPATTPRVDSSNVRASGWSLAHRGMRARGEPAGPVWAGPVGPIDGTDVSQRQAGGDQDDRNALPAGKQDRQGCDSG